MEQEDEYQDFTAFFLASTFHCGSINGRDFSYLSTLVWTRIKTKRRRHLLYFYIFLTDIYTLEETVILHVHQTYLTVTGDVSCQFRLSDIWLVHDGSLFYFYLNGSEAKKMIQYSVLFLIKSELHGDMKAWFVFGMSGTFWSQFRDSSTQINMAASQQEVSDALTRLYDFYWSNKTTWLKTHFHVPPIDSNDCVLVYQNLTFYKKKSILSCIMNLMCGGWNLLQ